MSSRPPGPDLTYLWGIVNRAVRDPELTTRPGGAVQNIWQSYQQAYLSRGEVPPLLGIQTVNQLVRTASAQARAEAELRASIQTFQRTGLNQAIVGQHIAPDIDRRPLAGETVPAFHRVRFDVNLNVEGIEVQHQLTWSPELNLPSSVSGLLDALTEAAQSAVENDSPIIGAEFVGLGDYVSITAV